MRTVTVVKGGSWGRGRSREGVEGGEGGWGEPYVVDKLQGRVWEGGEG